MAWWFGHLLRKIEIMNCEHSVMNGRAGFYMKVKIHDERMMVDAGAACPGLILEDNDDP